MGTADDELQHISIHAASGLQHTRSTTETQSDIDTYSTIDSVSKLRVGKSPRHDASGHEGNSRRQTLIILLLLSLGGSWPPLPYPIRLERPSEERGRGNGEEHARKVVPAFSTTTCGKSTRSRMFCNRAMHSLFRMRQTKLTQHAYLRSCRDEEQLIAGNFWE